MKRLLLTLVSRLLTLVFDKQRLYQSVDRLRLSEFFGTTFRLFVQPR